MLMPLYQRHQAKAESGERTVPVGIKVKVGSLAPAPSGRWAFLRGFKGTCFPLPWVCRRQFHGWCRGQQGTSLTALSRFTCQYLIQIGRSPHLVLFCKGPGNREQQFQQLCSRANTVEKSLSKVLFQILLRIKDKH